MNKHEKWTYKINEKTGKPGIKIFLINKNETENDDWSRVRFITIETRLFVCSTFCVLLFGMKTHKEPQKKK